MFLPGLNVFVACFGLLAIFAAAPVILLVSVAFAPAGQGLRGSSNAYLLPLAYGLLALPLLAFWWRRGLAPAKRAPGRERRYRLGHWLVALANVAAVATFAVPLAIAQLPGYQNVAFLAWFAVPGIALGLLLWPLGLFMIWSSRAALGVQPDVGLAAVRQRQLGPSAHPVVTRHPMLVTPMFLPNLNVFIACFALLSMYAVGPLTLLASFALAQVGLGNKGFFASYLYPLAYVLLAIPLLAFWWRRGLAPAKRAPERERRYRLGHWLVVLGNVATIAAFALPFAAVPTIGSQNLIMLTWIGISIVALRFLVWPLGLLMIWSSRAQPGGH